MIIIDWLLLVFYGIMFLVMNNIAWAPYDEFQRKFPGYYWLPVFIGWLVYFFLVCRFAYVFFIG